MPFSILAIFIIIMIVFKSISLPVILVAVIEFAIFVNMAIPYYQGTSLPFVASIVIGTIQLGATVDYAILMTSRYQKERGKGKDKKTAISIAHRASMLSIISSGFSFFCRDLRCGALFKGRYDRIHLYTACERCIDQHVCSYFNLAGDVYDNLTK